MNRVIYVFMIMTACIAMIGCDHSTNNIPAPEQTGLSIVSPVPDSYVNGIVSIDVQTEGVVPSIVEFYIDGNRYSTRSAAPWSVSWNTESLPSNSVHTIKAIAYNGSNSFTASQGISVRIK